jgi:hypothetical protein
MGATKDGLHAEEGEEVRRVLRDADLLRLAAATERHGAGTHSREALEGLRVLLPVLEMIRIDGQAHVG